MSDSHPKVTSRHLKRSAYLYIRQSTLRQVFENSESTKRQYALRQRAVALGWPNDQVIVIDTDLGQSGASATHREGFQKLVAEVGMGRAGIVLGLEVSRLARNSTDWHRLLEICALTDTLILDEDGVYDPAHFNDRLLLGLKGTMSEAELHVMRARLRGGLLAKARRGELAFRLPIGLTRQDDNRVVLDPDLQVQAALRMLFQTFSRTGAAHSTVKFFREQNIRFPRRLNAGPRKNDVVWEDLDLWRALSILHNPMYAGAYVFGRRRHRKQVDGRTKQEPLPPEEWTAFIKDAHPGYISWEEHARIQQQLLETRQAYGADRRHGPPREGPALLQGRLVCGLCGRRMTVRYHRRGDAVIPTYLCQVAGVAHAEAICQGIPGASIDAAVANLLVEAMTPMAIELAVGVQTEIQARVDEADRIRHQQVERAQYEVDLARARFMRVDPANRLVADSLEADWNAKLHALAEAQEHYERQRKADCISITEEQRKRLLALATDFPAVWRDPRTPQRERKRMAALLLEDVTLVKRDSITVNVRFRGGSTTTLVLPIPLNAWQGRTTNADVLVQIDVLLEQHTDLEAAAILNERGLKTGAGENFTGVSVQWARFSAGLKSLKQRLRAAGMLTMQEMAGRFGVTRSTLRSWRSKGMLEARVCNDKGEWLFKPPEVTPKLPARRKKRPPSRRALPKTTASAAGGAV